MKHRLITDCRALNHFLDPPIQVGNLGGHFPSFEEGLVWGQDRFKTRLFSYANKSGIQGIPPNKNRSKSVPIQWGPIWLKHPTLSMDSSNENLHQNLEKTRSSSLGLPGRHPDFGKDRKIYSKSYSTVSNNFGGSRNVHKLQEEHFTSSSEPGSSWFSSQFERGIFTGSSTKIKSHSQRTGEINNTQVHECAQNGCNFGTNPQFSNCNALPQGIHQQFDEICQHTTHPGMGLKSPNSNRVTTGSTKIGILLAEWKGRKFQGMPVTRVFHSDASNIAWAGKDLSSGRNTSDFGRDLPPNIGI